MGVVQDIAIHAFEADISCCFPTQPFSSDTPENMLPDFRSRMKNIVLTPKDGILGVHIIVITVTIRCFRATYVINLPGALDKKTV